MNRRAFGRRIAAVIAGLSTAPTSLPGLLDPGRSGTATGPPGAPRIDGARLLESMEALSRFGRTEEGGVHRVAFSDADLEGREYVRARMEAAGLRTRVDEAGNLVGRREGRNGALPTLMTGSHIDSVPYGGRYDGNVGTMGALEAARALHDVGHETRHPLEVVIFANEEGGKTGSRALVGEVEPEEWDLPTASGHTIGEGTRLLGGDPDRTEEALLREGDVHAFLELHVEQGAVLHGAGIDIGVVEGIVGLRRWNGTVEGFTNHAGTTPMDQRQDALVAAARFVDTTNRTVREMPGTQVATVGRISAEPGAPNVIPGRAVFSLEIRDVEMERIAEIFEILRGESERIGEETGTTFAFEPFYLSGAAPTHPRIRDVVEATARETGHSTLRMPSGAGHDAQSLAVVAPIGMIFVPSVDGISHSPREFTRPEDIVAGAQVLLGTLLEVDGMSFG